MDALASLADWPVDHSAAAVVWPDQSVSRAGDTDRVMALASVTKLITALAIHVATEEGTVALGDLVGPAGATLADLLAHASGLGPDGSAKLAEPRQRRIYSNHGYGIAAEHLAVQASMSHQTYSTEAVLEPLGMRNTTLADPAAGARSSVDDLVRFVAALQQPLLVSDQTLDALATPHLGQLGGVLPGFGRQDPNPWGLGPEVRGTKHPHWTGSTNDPSTFGHFGQTGTFLWVDPARACALVVLTDRPFGPWALTRWPTLADAVLAELAG